MDDRAKAVRDVLRLQTIIIKFLEESEMMAVEELSDWVGEFLAEEDEEAFFSNLVDQVTGLGGVEVLQDIYKQAFVDLYKWVKEGEVIVQ